MDNGEMESLMDRAIIQLTILIILDYSKMD